MKKYILGVFAICSLFNGIVNADPAVPTIGNGECFITVQNLNGDPVPIRLINAQVMTISTPGGNVKWSCDGTIPEGTELNEFLEVNINNNSPISYKGNVVTSYADTEVGGVGLPCKIEGSEPNSTDWVSLLKKDGTASMTCFLHNSQP